MVATNARENGQSQRKADLAVRTPLKGGYKEDRAPPPQGATWRRQAALGTSCTWRGFVSTRDTSVLQREQSSLNNLPRDTVESPSLEAYERQLDSALDNLIPAHFSHGRLDLIVFGGPFQPGLPYSSMILGPVRPVGHTAAPQTYEIQVGVVTAPWRSRGTGCESTRRVRNK